MTINAAGSRHSIGLVSEVVAATTPANPVFTNVRHVSTTIQLSKASLKSKEIRPDRQIVGFRHGIRSVTGDIVAEVAASPGLDTLLAAALMGSWSTLYTTGQTTLSAAVGSFAQAANSFITDGFVVGDTIVASGFVNAGNNGRFQVTAVAALTLTVNPMDGQVMVVEAAAAARELDSNDATLATGLLRPTFTIERHFADIGQYIRYRGCEIDKLALKVSSGAIGELTFTVMGINADPAAQVAIAGATYPAASTTSPMTGIEGTLKEGGAVYGFISGVQFDLNNTMKANDVIGQNYGIQPSVGQSDITGSVTAYFADVQMYNKFDASTASSLDFTLKDALGNNTYTFHIGNLLYNSAPVPVTSDGPITLTIPFQGLLDTVTGTNLLITRH